MSEHEVYEKWKTQRGSVEPASDFAQRVMSSTANDQATVDPPRIKSQPVASRYAAALTAVIAASLLGMFRMTFALLIGIINL
jgi:hypothetical protein